MYIYNAISFRSVKPFRLIKRNTLRKSTMYFRSIYEDSNHRHGYGRRYGELKTRLKDHRDDEPKIIQSRIKDAIALNKILMFFSNSTGRRCAGWRHKERKLNSLDGELHVELLEKECEEIKEVQLFKDLWEERWKPQKRFVIRWRDGSKARFFASDCICMLGRAQVASKRRKAKHLVNYVDLNRLDLDRFRKTVEECNMDFLQFFAYYLCKRKNGHGEEPPSTYYFCRYNNFGEKDKDDKFREKREKNSKKAHRKEALNSILRGYE